MDARLGRAGEWIGIENYVFLWGDSVTRLALFNTLFYTTVASVLKCVLGLWLALLLNKNIRLKTFFRAVILLPYIVPTALSALMQRTVNADWVALPVPPSLLGESPFWHPDEAALYWVDIPGKALHRWHTETDIATPELEPVT